MRRRTSAILIGIWNGIWTASIRLLESVLPARLIVPHQALALAVEEAVDQAGGRCRGRGPRGAGPARGGERIGEPIRLRRDFGGRCGEPLHLWQAPSALPRSPQRPSNRT